jgi:biopolymer transport protein ExbD
MASIGTSRRGLHSRSDLPMNAEINVTSLVDVAFTLLVIFIITAPILQGGVEVAIPRADVRPLTSQENPLFVTVRRDGVILLEETPVTLDELVEGLPQLLAGGTIDQVYIRADSLAPYGPVLRTIAAAASSGVRFALVAEPFRGR